LLETTIMITCSRCQKT